ncbi:hypothetical protein EB796_000107 [Bugula neritina]|uniref:Uncharacterized protein n=1 Tax=Bugula neritina TaxID=10212 RepID=A0A7J7KTU3_BUGNE|nr:hypothetical protein EB796_000107 [Bugula neritina]
MMEADASFSCPHCNEVLETRNGKPPKFCPECGESIEIVSPKPELFCPECGVERTVNKKTGVLRNFCCECGYKFLPEGASKTVKVLSSSKAPGTVLATTDGSLETDKCEVQKSAATSVASSVTESKRDSSAGDAPIKSVETNQGLTNLNKKQPPTADIIQNNADVPCKGDSKLKEATCSDKKSDNSIPSDGKPKNFTNNAEANNVEIAKKPDKIPLNEGKPEETVVSKSNLDQSNQVEQTSNLPSALATPSNKTDSVLSSDEDQSETKTTSSSCKVGRKTSTSSDSEEFHDAPDAWHSAESTSTADAGNPVLSKSDVHNSDIRHSIAKSTTEKEAPSLTSTEQGARSTLTSEKDSPSTGFTEKNALTNLTQECSPSIDITGKEVTTRGEEAPSAATTEKKIPSAATTGKKIPSATTTGDEAPLQLPQGRKPPLNLPQETNSPLQLPQETNSPLQLPQGRRLPLQLPQKTDSPQVVQSHKRELFL